MAISYVGGGVGTNAVTLPAFASGDIAIAFAFRDGSATNPSIATGWTQITNTTDGTSCSVSVAWRRLINSDTATGTFTNASRMSVLVYRGCEPFITPVGGTGASNGTTNAAVSFPAIASMTRGDGTSWVACFIGHRSVDQDVEVAPSGLTARAAGSGVNATAESDGFDTNGGVASWSAHGRASTGTASGWVAYSVELLALPTQTPADVTRAPPCVCSTNNRAL